ncbi:hypothetical protein BCT92_00265 [Vibrio sp. 10N.261.52.E5]|nr:recombinase family protein [Vibrio sp. 10N.261.52.E5]PMK84829.1 hypothetical protein BCT92_00265 [Vibrio sp. 10N.261.52.E5]
MFEYDKSKFKGICIPYARFSTQEQDKVGRKSLDRQLGEARRFAEQSDLYINEDLIFSDKGVSGFSHQGQLSKAFDKGQMAVMLELLERVPPHERENVYIAFHNIDRFSRMSPQDALEQFNRILKRGFKIVTTIDDSVYSNKEANLDNMLISIIKMSSAHYESQVKSVYVSDAYTRKRAVIEYLYNHDSQRGKHKHIGIKQAATPRWIEEDDIVYEYTDVDGVTKRDTFKKFTINEEKATIVNRIFEMKIDGLGHTKICQILNDEGIETFEDGNYRKAKKWHIFAIQNLFKNEHVLGTFVLKTNKTEEYYCDIEKVFKSRKLKVTATEKLHNYYPAIVSKENFDKAQRQIANNKIEFDRSKPYEEKTHVFSQLLTCSCGGRMVYKSTRKKNKKKTDDYFEYLRCERSILNDGCEAQNIGYKLLEDSFLRYIEQFDMKLFQGEQSKTKVKIRKLEKQIKNLEVKMNDLKSKSDGLNKTFNNAISQGLDASFVLTELNKNERQISLVDVEHKNKHLALNNTVRLIKNETESISKSSMRKALNSCSFEEKLSMRKKINEFLKLKVMHFQVCSTQLTKFVIVCFSDSVIRTFCYQNEFSSDLMFNSIKVDITNLEESDGYVLFSKLIKAIDESLQGKTQVITKTDLNNYLVEIKRNHLNSIC